MQGVNNNGKIAPTYGRANLNVWLRPSTFIWRVLVSGGEWMVQLCLRSCDGHRVAVCSFHGHRAFVLLTYPFHLRSTGDCVGVYILPLGLPFIGDVFRVCTIDVHVVEFNHWCCCEFLSRETLMVREVFYMLELLVQMNCIHTWDGESAMNLLTSIIDAAYYVMC